MAVRKEKINGKYTGKWIAEYQPTKDKGNHFYAAFNLKKEAEQQYLFWKKKYSKVKTELLFFDLYENYISFKKQTQSVSVVSNKESVFRLHIQPFFPNKALGRYEKRDLSDFQLALLNNGRTEKTINRVSETMSQVMNYAVENGYLEINPFDKYRRFSTKRNKPVILSVKDFHAYIATVKDPLFHLLFRTAFETGLREGEILALQWKCVDLKNGILHIFQHQDTINPLIIKPGRKNNEGYSTYLSSDLKDEFKSFYSLQSKTYGFNDNFFVFGDIRPIGRTTLKKKHYAALKASNLPHMRFHDFRHSCATIILQETKSPTLAADRLGDSIGQIMKTYGHVLKTEQKEWINILDNVFSEKNE